MCVMGKKRERKFQSRKTGEARSDKRGGMLQPRQGAEGNQLDPRGPQSEADGFAHRAFDPLALRCKMDAHSRKRNAETRSWLCERWYCLGGL